MARLDEFDFRSSCRSECCQAGSHALMQSSVSLIILIRKECFVEFDFGPWRKLIVGDLDI
jgi:hypothetical protein